LSIYIKDVAYCTQLCSQLSCVHTATTNRDEGADILILARTDARGVLGMDEAIARCLDFKQAGADIIFLEVSYYVQSVITRHNM
jgi:2-methylisocitrate lyase-like PEP mutase family enzyme